MGGDASLYNLPIDGSFIAIKSESRRTNSIIPKRKFTAEDDNILRSLVMMYGTNWEMISKMMPGRNVRQCRDRWNNYINPALSTRPFTPEEDNLLISLYNTIGSKWSKIAKHFHRRSDNSIRNRWNYLSRQFDTRVIGSSPNLSSDEHSN